MIVSPTWAGKRYAVLGLARSGAATVRALLAAGASVVAWDSDETRRAAFSSSFPREGGGPDSVRSTERAAARDPLLDPHLRGGTVDIKDPDTLDLTQFDAFVVSPGVPLNRHPLAAKARAAGVPIIGDIELFAQARASLPPHKVVGITGTNGKSTTTALVHHILQTAGVPSLMGGNIGLPILEQEPLPEGGVYVLELSSYQIDLTQTLDCDVAVLLNITPDHLDRYDGFEAYAASKARLFEMQTSDHVAVAHARDWWRSDQFQGAGQFSNAGSLDVYDDAFHIYQAEPGAIAIYEQPQWPSLQGPHNLLNVSATMSVCYILGLTGMHIRHGLCSYPGLAHRMERIVTVGGVAYINDSKATNPDSTAPALAAFDRIHWILGGQSKTDGIDACAPSFGRVVRAYTIGEAAVTFAALLKGKVPVEQSGTLDVAVTSAAANARAGDTVLLSPACASFDQFRDFEDRGDQFRALVEALA